MRKIDHENLLKLYNVYETVHSIYLCLMLVTGGDLNSKVSFKLIKSWLDFK